MVIRSWSRCRIYHSKTLLPPAIRAAKRHNGKIILLNVIEIPYQLPPSEAEQFILERECELEYARLIIETAECDAEIMVRIAHRLPYAIEQVASSSDIDLIIIWAMNNGLLWNNQIHQKLHAVNSNFVIAKVQVESHFEKVIIKVDDLATANTMLEQAACLLGSDEGSIYIIPGYSTRDEQSSLNKLQPIVDAFQRQNPWFGGQTIINQLQPKTAAREYLKDIYYKGTGSTCMLVSYPSGKKFGAGTWLKDEAEELNLPVFLSKVGRVEPVGIDQLTNKLTNWLGITF